MDMQTKLKSFVLKSFVSGQMDKYEMEVARREGSSGPT